MNVLVTYGDKKYRNARFWCTFTGKHLAKFDKIYAFGPENVDTRFRAEHTDIFKYKRGNGLWLWKPYFVYKVINACSNGDTIFYCDAGAIFRRTPDYIYRELDKSPMFCCDIPLIESNFTKPECFGKILGENVDEVKRSNQIIATFFALRVCDETKKFVKEWLEACCDIGLLSPQGTNIGLTQNYGEAFVAHREDQSLFSLLCKKYGYRPHRDISQRGGNPRSYYNPYYIYKEPKHDEDASCPTILWLHKSPNLGVLFWGKYLLRRLRGRIYLIIGK